MDAVAGSWEAELLREISHDWENGRACNIASLLRDLLSQEQAGSSPAETACRIDADYRENYLRSDRRMRSREDRGMAAFLYRLYELSFTLGRLIDYDDPRQDRPRATAGRAAQAAAEILQDLGGELPLHRAPLPHGPR